MTYVHMTRKMRDLLIEHIDGPVIDNTIQAKPLPLADSLSKETFADNTDRHQRRLSIWRCLERGWLDMDRKVNPTATFLTDKGKHALCAVLAELADTLVRAGFNWDSEVEKASSLGRQETHGIERKTDG